MSTYNFTRVATEVISKAKEICEEHKNTQVGNGLMQLARLMSWNISRCNGDEPMLSPY
jgi:hypothetical protein